MFKHSKVIHRWQKSSTLKKQFKLNFYKHINSKKQFPKLEDFEVGPNKNWMVSLSREWKIWRIENVKNHVKGWV